jgi:hypothetical protein
VLAECDRLRNRTSKDLAIDALEHLLESDERQVGGLGELEVQPLGPESEEARHETCFECGSWGGRHASICSRAKTP